MNHQEDTDPLLFANQNEQNGEQTTIKSKGNMPNIGKRIAATLAGTTLGIDTVLGAEKFIDNPQNKSNVVIVKEHQPSNENNNLAENEIIATPELTDVTDEEAPSLAQPEAVIYAQEDTAHQSPIEPESQTISQEPNEQYVGDIHVVDVCVADNGKDGITTLANLQSKGDNVIVVDVESDGVLDYAFHDDNGDGIVDLDEIVAIGEDHIATAKVIEAYIEESNSQNLKAIVSDVNANAEYIAVKSDIGCSIEPMGDFTPEDNILMASADDEYNNMDDIDNSMLDV